MHDLQCFVHQRNFPEVTSLSEVRQQRREKLKLVKSATQSIAQSMLRPCCTPRGSRPFVCYLLSSTPLFWLFCLCLRVSLPATFGLHTAVYFTRLLRAGAATYDATLQQQFDALTNLLEDGHPQVRAVAAKVWQIGVCSVYSIVGGLL